MSTIEGKPNILTGAKRGLRAALVAAVMAAPHLVALTAWAAETIRSVEVEGNRRLEGATIRLQAGLDTGGTCAPARLDAALKATFATGQFSDVRITCSNGVARIVVAENDVVGTLSFEGRSAIEEKELVEAAKLPPRAVFTRARGEAAAERIRALYRQRGYGDATVEVRTSPIGGGRVAVSLAIAEGRTVKVERIAFAGNTSFSASQLRDVITTRQAGVFDFLLPVTAPVHDRLDHDRSLLGRHYMKHGFVDVQVGPATLTRAPRDENGKEGGWLITFTIDEGERFAFGGMRSRTGADTALAGLLPAAGLEPGAVFDAERLDKAVERMTAALIDQGRRTAQVVARTTRDPKQRIVDIEFDIVEVAQLTVERIEISGNRKTRDEVIRRDLDMSEGDVYHPMLAELARKRLLRLGFFKTVEIRTAETTKGSGKIALTVAVEEVESRELGFGVGYSQTEGIIGDVSFAERNFMGLGQQVNLKLAGSMKSAQAQLSFTEPRLLGTRLAGGIDLFYRDTDALATSSFKSTRWGGAVRLGTEVAANTTATFNYSLSRSTLYEIGPDASQAVKLSIPGYPGATSASYTTSSVGYQLAYDTRDNRKIAMSGLVISGGQDIAGVGGDARFVRSTIDARVFVPVTESFQLVARASGGTIAGWGGSEVRLLDNFYRGGETVRGFAPSGIGPRDVLSARRDALGGTSTIATTAEARFSVPYVSEQTGLRGAVFADAGTLFGTSRTAKALPSVVGTTPALRASVGVGVIWDSPVGPLQAGYAIPVAKQGFDKTQNHYFGLGPGL